MPRRALRCSADITLHAVTCPGVWLPRRDDVFLSIRMLGQVRRTQLMTPMFPLLIHERFRFDKVFYTAFEPSQVAGYLEAEPVVVELIQISDIYEGGRLLAEYCCSAKDFLYPYPSYTATYGTQDRELLLDASIDFPGISPKIEFSTKSVIRETAANALDYIDVEEPVRYSSRYGQHSAYTGSYSGRSKYRSSKGRKRRYGDPTIASISRSRSISPSISSRLEELYLDEHDEYLDDKPPFVVKKVDKSLIGRVPGNQYSPRRRRSASPGRSLSRSYGSGKYDYLDDSYTVRPAYSYSKTREPYDDYYYGKYSGYPRPTTATSYYHSSLADRFGESRYSPSTSQLISSRVDHAMRRHRSLENLDTLGGSYGRTRKGNSEADYDDSLDELGLDFEKARPRRYH